MELKANLEYGEFPTCEKCLHSSEINPKDYDYRLCRFFPEGLYKLRKGYCSQGMWQNWKTSGGCLHLLDFENAYTIWYFAEYRKQEEQEEANRIRKLLFLDFSYLGLGE